MVIGAGGAQQGQSPSLESCLLCESPRNPCIYSTTPGFLWGPATLQSCRKSAQVHDLHQHRWQQLKVKPHTWLSPGCLALQRALLPPCTQPPTSPQSLPPSFLASTPKSPRCLIHAWISLQFQPLECDSQLGSQAAGCMAAASFPSQGSSGVKLRSDNSGLSLSQPHSHQPGSREASGTLCPGPSTHVSGRGCAIGVTTSEQDPWALAQRRQGNVCLSTANISFISARWKRSPPLTTASDTSQPHAPNFGSCSPEASHPATQSRAPSYGGSQDPADPQPGQEPLPLGKKGPSAPKKFQ